MPAEIAPQPRCIVEDGKDMQAHGRKHGLWGMPSCESMATFKTLKQIRQEADAQDRSLGVKQPNGSCSAQRPSPTLDPVFNPTDFAISCGSMPDPKQQTTT